MKLTDELIDDYLEGALSGTSKQEFEGLLKSDASARVRVDEARLFGEMLGASAPDVPSQRLWAKIRSEITRAPELSFFEKLAHALGQPRLRLGLGFTAAACLVVVGLQIARKPVPMAEPIELAPEAAAPSSAPALSKPVHVAALPRAKKAQAPAAQALASKAEAPLAKAVPREPTEVERALSDQRQNRDLDDTIAGLLRERQAASMGAAPMAAAERPGAAVRTVSYSDTMDSGVPSNAAEVDSAALKAMPSRIDANGFWNFRPAAMALNRRDWLTASNELSAAAQQAPEAAERAFARSTLQLLSLGGQPVVAKVGLADAKGLNVQSAERWQVFVDNHVARYSGSVVTRLPGLRSEGDELLLDMAFDRASFSPGTRFIRLSGDEMSKVTGPQGETLQGSEFRAVRGADYLLRANELRLK